GAAHPVPKDNHDRTLVVRLTPAGLIVDYRLELDEYRAARDLPRSELEGVDSRKDFHAAFRRYHADVLANNLFAALDGKPLEFSCTQQRHQILDHVRCDYRSRARWKLSPGKPPRFPCGSIPPAPGWPARPAPPASRRRPAAPLRPRASPGCRTAARPP